MGLGDWTLRALVDTGAPITFFDRGAGDALGVNYGHAGAERGMVVVLGGTWDVQFEMVDLCLPVDPSISWTARIAFASSPQLVMPFQGVLGTDGFLDKFAVTFNRYYDYFVIERPDDFHERVGAHLLEDPVRTADTSWRRDRGK